MTAFRAGDAADGELIAGPGEAFQAEGRRIGEIRQRGFAGDGVCPAAFEAWCGAWMERWPELAGVEAEQPWRMEDFMTVSHLEEAMHSAAGGKTPGANGFTVEALRAAPSWLLAGQGVRDRAAARPLTETAVRAADVRLLLARVVELTAGPLGTRAAPVEAVAQGRAASVLRHRLTRRI